MPPPRASGPRGRWLAWVIMPETQPPPRTAPAPGTGVRRQPALSPSRANDYRQCPLKYRLRAIDRIPEPKTLAQVKGTLVHAVLEQLHTLERAGRTYPAAVARLKPTWAGMVEEDAELAALVPEESLLDFLVECRGLLKGYFMLENPRGFDAAEVERFVNLRLGDVPARGFIDRVDVAPTGEVRIVDYKTGRKPAPRFRGEALFQMRFYALAWWRLTGRVPDQLRLMYLRVADDLVHVPRARELEAFQAELSRLWGRIRADGEHGDFAPRTSRLCDWCSFHALCPAQGGTPPEYPGWPGDADGGA